MRPVRSTRQGKARVHSVEGPDIIVGGWKIDSGNSILPIQLFPKCSFVLCSGLVSLFGDVQEWGLRQGTNANAKIKD